MDVNELLPLIKDKYKDDFGKGWDSGYQEYLRTGGQRPYRAEPQIKVGSSWQPFEKDLWSSFWEGAHRANPKAVGDSAPVTKVLKVLREIWGD
jgi:hypothetical protein